MIDRVRRAATFSPPPAAGHVIEPLTGMSQDLAGYGYVEEELFASGTARAFRATAAPADGRWSVTATTAAPYRTRVLVRRPADAGRFNGTVVVEWMNVSAGESAPDWDYLNPELMRGGYAYVAVSAQAVAVDGGKPLLGPVGAQPTGGLVGAEPDRYGTLRHPGDQYSLDMFAQVGRALRDPAGRSALGGLHPQHIVAVGESQSAFYLTTFADAVQPVTHAFDGFFIHSRGGSGVSLEAGPGAAPAPQALRIRADLDVPVFMFETQTDLVQLGYAAARQPDTARIRTWEVAGTAHADAYLVGANAALLGCTQPVNDGPQHEVAQAALAALGRWVAHGTPPPEAAPFRLESTSPPVLGLDGHGNVIGGVRTPAVDVPVATLSGAPPPGASPICALFGSTTPFSGAQLSALYGDRATYLARYERSLDGAIAGGFLLAADRPALVARAEQVPFGP